MNWRTMLLKYPLQEHGLACVIISDNLTWNKRACLACSKYSFVRRNPICIKYVSVRRSIYLRLVGSHLWYEAQLWAPQSTELVVKVEWMQWRASKYILNLPFHCQPLVKDKLIQLMLLPLRYWHKYRYMESLLRVVTERIYYPLDMCSTMTY